MPVTDESWDLLSRARAGDVDAFEGLVNQYAPMVYRVALRIVGNAEDAQDCSQRALLSAWQGLGCFRGDASFPTWLHTIARRHALNCVTRAVRTVSVEQVSEPADSHRRPDQSAVDRDSATFIHAAIRALPPAQCSVIRLFHFEQLSYAQVAGATGSTESAVRSQLFRARRSLALALADQR